MMTKLITVIFLFCVLITSSGCGNRDKFDKWLLSDAFSSKTETEKQKDEQKITQFKSMMGQLPIPKGMGLH